MEPLILKDKNIFPTKEVLADVLKASFPAYEAFNASAETAGLTLEWNYYNDGKAWLCKILSKKKNLGWLIVYPNFFRINAYFAERHLERIAEMDIAESIKEEFYQQKPSGKLIQMSINITDKDQVKDALTMILFKKGLK